MKSVLLATLLCIGSLLSTGCTTSGGGGAHTGGIDPITMQGIEDSNRAAQEAAQRQSQQAIDQANLNMMQQANQQAADAAAAAAAAANRNQ